MVRNRRHESCGKLNPELSQVFASTMTFIDNINLESKKTNLSN